MGVFTELDRKMSTRRKYIITNGTSGQEKITVAIEAFNSPILSYESRITRIKDDIGGPDKSGFR